MYSTVNTMFVCLNNTKLHAIYLNLLSTSLYVPLQQQQNNYVRCDEHVN